ncbi:MAG: hypothetical protein ACK4NF_05890 [Planctomycetota bacterium]
MKKRECKKKEVRKRKEASSLVEIVISVFILTIILFGAMGAYIFIIKDNKSQVYRTLAYKKCQEVIENVLATSINTIPQYHNTTFSIDFLEGLPPQDLGKIYVTDISGNGTLYQIRVEIRYNGDSDHPPIYVYLIARKAKL